MYENGNRDRSRRAPRARGASPDEFDARAQARRALQDCYDWRDDEPRAHAAAAVPATAAASGASARPLPAEPGSRERSASAARAERRSRRQFVRSISRTVGV